MNPLVKLASFGFLFCLFGCQPEVSTTEQSDTVAQNNSSMNSLCPDDQKTELDHCKFVALTAELEGDGNAKSRYDRAAKVCGNYNQTTMNFCLKTLYKVAVTDLLNAFELARPSPDGTAYDKWKRSNEARCTPDYPPEEGGTAYSARITFCELNGIAAKIDQLSSTLKPGT